MSQKLDLHGTRHEDVDRIVENFILLNETPLSIITGNSHTMRSKVYGVCERHNIKYEQWSSGEIKVL